MGSVHREYNRKRVLSLVSTPLRHVAPLINPSDAQAGVERWAVGNNNCCRTNMKGRAAKQAANSKGAGVGPHTNVAPFKLRKTDAVRATDLDAKLCPLAVQTKRLTDPAPQFPTRA